MTNSTEHGIRVLKATEAPRPPRSFLDELHEALASLGEDEVIELTGKTMRTVGTIIARVSREQGKTVESWAAGDNVYVRVQARSARPKRTGTEPAKSKAKAVHAAGQTANGTACGHRGPVAESIENVTCGNPQCRRAVAEAVAA